MKKVMEKQNNFIFYTTSDGRVEVDVMLQDENVWLTQKSMSALFGVDVRTVSEHLGNIFNFFELEEDSVIRKFRNTASDGKQYTTNFYNLDAIIAVGYRVNSYQATQFRKWATSVLKEYMIKGFALDDDRLKQGKRLFGKDYFDELLERIREIRASERRFYQKITDIYSQCSIDYDKNSDITKNFYKTVQNKLHWSITGHTAAELIKERADSDKPHMGLKTWKNSPEGKVLKSDVTVAKNYLNEKELKDLNRIVTMYLDYAENQAEKQNPMRMEEWIKKLDAFLSFNEYDVLNDSGKVSAQVAKELAEKEYEKFRKVQDIEFVSDFDKEIKKLMEKKK